MLTIEDLFNKNLYISIETSNEVLHGFITSWSDSYIIIQREYDGTLDGWNMILRTNIIKIMTDETSRFWTNVYHKEFHKETLQLCHITLEKGIAGLYTYLREKNLFVFIESNDNITYLGKIKNFNKNIITLETISSQGYYSDIIDLPIEKIICHQWGTTYNRMYEKYTVTQK